MVMQNPMDKSTRDWVCTVLRGNWLNEVQELKISGVVVFMCIRSKIKMRDMMLSVKSVIILQ